MYKDNDDLIFVSDDEWNDMMNPKTPKGVSIPTDSSKTVLEPISATTGFDPSSMRPEGMSDDDWNLIVSSNPYASSNISKTNWDEFLNGMGFRSKYDAAEAERLQNSKNYISQSIERWRQDKYNAPAQQVKRELEAGINPNINGNVDNVPSVGSPDSLSPLSDMSDAFAPMDLKLGDIIGAGLSALSTVCQISNGVMDMGKRKAELRNLDSFTTNSIFDFAESFANRTVPDESTIPEFEQYIKQGFTPQEAFSFIMDNTLTAAAKEAEDGTPWFRNKRNARLFTKSLSEYKQSSKYKEVKNRAFSAYVNSYEDRVFDQAELDELMKDYNDFIGLVNEYYYPTIQADYQTYLSEAETLLANNATLRQQYALDQQIIAKETQLLPDRMAAEQAGLKYTKENYDKMTKALAIDLAKIEAQKKIVAKIEAKITAKEEKKKAKGKDDDLDMTTLMFYNQLLNTLNSNLISEAARLGVDIGKSALSFGKGFIRPRPRTNINYNFRR